MLSGSTIGIMPVSSSAVVAHMAFDPDMAWAWSGCSTIRPTSARRVAGGQQQAERPRRAGARFRAQPAAQPVVDRVQVVQLVGHGRAGDVQHAAGDDAADLARAMHVDGLDRAAETA
jgi:hypothetical protein